MSIKALNRQIDFYKQSDTTTTRAGAVLGAQSVLRSALALLGIRSEAVYIEKDKLIFELEPGGSPAVLSEMLKKK